MRAGKAPARVRFVDGATVDDDYYWLSPEHLADFERRAAEQARGARSGVFGTPMLMLENDTEVSYGPPGSVTQILPDSFETLWVLAFDLDEGFTVNRCPYGRRPDGEPVFGDVQIYQGDMRLDDACPGFGLLRTLLH